MLAAGWSFQSVRIRIATSAQGHPPRRRDPQRGGLRRGSLLSWGGWPESGRFPEALAVDFRTVVGAEIGGDVGELAQSGGDDADGHNAATGKNEYVLNRRSNA